MIQLTYAYIYIYMHLHFKVTKQKKLCSFENGLDNGNKFLACPGIFVSKTLWTPLVIKISRLYQSFL